MDLLQDRPETIPVNTLSHVLGSDLIPQSQQDRVEDYAKTMQRDGYVKFPSLFSELAHILRQDTSAFRSDMRMKDFQMPEVNSRRTMKVLSGSELANASPVFFTFYFHHELRSFLGRVAGRPVHSVQHKSEFMVSNMLSGQGHTHGWHLDDPQLALVIFLNAPDPVFGGTLEYIPNWREICLEKGIDPNVDVEATIQILGDEVSVITDEHHAGDAYLLNAASHLHRVTPLTEGGGERWVVNMAFDTRKQIDFGETADLLYG